MSRVNKTNWKYVNSEDNEKRMLGQLKRENGGRDISKIKKEKIKKKAMFNYNQE